MNDKRFSRTGLLLGKEGLLVFASSRVAVFGLGGVGGFAVEALARAGIGYLRLVDFDTIQISNFNRQILALDSTLGKLKVEVAAGRIAEINPKCVVEQHAVFVDKNNVSGLVSDIDYVVDAIDGVSSKVHLLAAAVTAKSPVISCFGSARRVDPGSISCADIDESNNCPLAKIVRKRLHQKGIRTGIKCVYSSEPVRGLDTDTEIEEDNSPAIRGRVRSPLGSSPWLPGIFGLTIASEVLRDLYPMH